MIDQPNAALPAASPLTRRSFFGMSALSLGTLAAAPLAAQAGAPFGSGFTHGIASGEPAARSVLLWTRFVAPHPTTLQFEVSDRQDFGAIVAGGTVEASPEHDCCAKAVATGLEPGCWYFYRFVAPNGAMSPVGRTRTLPEGATDKFRMAVFSCSNMGFGWFNAYRHACEQDAFDLAVHLGDYFYEYDYGHYPAKSQAVTGRVPEPLGETIHLADYRARYASYRRDPDLARLHQIYPTITVWDDHESANDSWKGGAENHQPDTEGEWSVRKAAAMRAYREWMPVSDANWASYDIGDLATLFRLETRLTGRDKQLDLAAALKGTDPAHMQAALEAFKMRDWENPARNLMGADQQQWLSSGMKQSVGAGRKWQVLVQQIVMGSLFLPPEVAEGLSADTPDYVRQRLAAGVLASKVGIPFNLDSWDGYPAARQRLLDAAKEADANLVVLSGDSHNAWACELDGAGVEFAGHSVTSPGAEAYLGWKKPQDTARELVASSPDLKWAETANRGYMAVELTPERASSEWRFMDTIRKRSDVVAKTHSMSTAYGARRFTEA